MSGRKEIRPPDTKVLEDIWLSFYFGAKIGVLGLNGAGKSSLLRIMAGEDQRLSARRFPAEGISIGMLHQEPHLDPAKDVRGNVERGVRETHLLERYDDVNAKLGEDLSPEEMDKVLDEQSKIQDRIDAANAWDLDSRLELAMDALRLPAARRRRATLSGGERRRVALCRLLLRRPTCCCSTSRPTTSTPNRWRGSSASSRTTRARSSPSPTIATFSTTWPAGFSSSIAATAFRGRATTRRGSSRSRPPRQQEEKAETRAAKTSERELEWIRMSPRARQAKGKARLNAYEELLREGVGERSRAPRSTSRPVRASATSSSKRGASRRATATTC